MRKLLGLFSVCALVGVAAGVNGAGATPPSGPPPEVTEYGRAQQVENGKVVASSGYDVQSTTYTLAPGGDTGWRAGPGTTALAVTKGALKIEQAEGCASSDLAAGNALVLAPGKFRLQNAGQEPVELMANFTGLTSGGAAPLDGPADSAPACGGITAAAAEANGLSATKSFRGDPSAYYRQAHAGHGGGDAYGASSELAVEAGKDATMMTFVLQPGFSTGWFAHTPHVAIITKGTWAFFEARDGKCEKVEEYRAGEAWVHPLHRHMGAVQGSEPVEITVFGFNMNHGEAKPVLNSQPDHLDFAYAPPSECPTQVR
jgi:quercetin dioxygenase-like cupin family protein